MDALMMRRLRVGVAAVALSGLPASPAQAAPVLDVATPVRELPTSATPAKLLWSHGRRISSTLTGPAGLLAGEALEFQRGRPPYGRFIFAPSTITVANGSHSFHAVHAEHDTRFRVAAGRTAGRLAPTVDVLVRSRAYPSSRRVLAAARYLARRAGTKAFAVINSHGRLAGLNMHRRFHSASVVKSMLLVAYLQMLAEQHRALDGASEALLYPMIHSSDNEAASAVLAIVGEAALDRVAREAHMADYEPGGAFWGFTEISAADLARFFLHQEALIPRRFEGYARWLLSTIEPSESWGIPAVARPKFQVFFKGGWLPESEGLVNQVARLERWGTVFALAVLTIHDPSMIYGEQTIEGVTARLLGRPG
jgi:hypothetical protein